MQFDLSWPQLIATLVAGGGIVAGVTIGSALLARQGGSRQANVAFGALLLVAAAVVLYVLLVYVQPPGENLGVVFAPLPFTFALGPLLYAYVRARLGKRWPGAVHWVLPAAQAAVVVGVALAPLGVKQAYMDRVFAPWWATVQVAVFAVGFAVYLALAWQEVRAAPAAYEWARARDRWLRLVVRTTAVVLAGVLVFALVGPLVPDLYQHRVGGVRWVPLAESLLYSAALYGLAVGGFVQADLRRESTSPRVLTPEPPPTESAPLETADRKERYNLDRAATDAIAASLQRLVAEDRPHLDPNLTLGLLADQLGVTDKVLSFVLNDTLGTTYADFVNGLRVDEARRRLAAPEARHLTVLAVGLDAGFASKSTFNRVFKEQTGETPSAFRQRALAERATAPTP